MFDIRCPKCGEPWDNDCLHEAHEYGAPEMLSYRTAAKLFAQFGCGLFNELPRPCTSNPCESPDEMAQINARMALSDHPDEWVI
jgi:hypothetical protein